MAKCPNCGFADAGNFCPQCGTTIPKQKSKVHSVSGGNNLDSAVKIVCPQCQHQETHTFNLSHLSVPKAVETIQCASCRTKFLSRIVTVRAKRSRGDKKKSRRTYTVRVVELSGGEDLIEFIDANYNDFELRTKDIAIFYYIRGKLRLVQNITIGQYTKISDPSCFIATSVYGHDSYEVKLLRNFRDKILLKNHLLLLLVRIYYLVSPAIVKWFGNKKYFKKLMKVILNPILHKIEKYARN